MSSRIYFASSNRHKFEEAKSILAGFGLDLKFYRCSLEEVQDERLEKIARHKAREAYSMISKPVIVEDVGLFISSLKGFPGPYSSYVFDTLGNKGLLKLVSRDRTARFRSVIAYCGARDRVMLFSSNVRGRIAGREKGSRWGYDPIFIPEGHSLTYSQIPDKNLISHRYLALRKFANWYLHTRKSVGP